MEAQEQSTKKKRWEDQRARVKVLAVLAPLDYAQRAGVGRVPTSPAFAQQLSPWPYQSLALSLQRHHTEPGRYSLPPPLLISHLYPSIPGN